MSLAESSNPESTIASKTNKEPADTAKILFPKKTTKEMTSANRS